MTYAAYLRVYEPVSAFPEPDRSRWAAYAASPTRPARRGSVAAEHLEALRRAAATPQIVVPDRESEHAYVRRADGVTYVCPWQTRLRCLISYSRVRSAPGSPLAGTLPAGEEERAAAAMARLARERREGGARLHILASNWAVPLAWFVPFAAGERWLALGLGQSARQRRRPRPARGRWSTRRPCPARAGGRRVAWPRCAVCRPATQAPRGNRCARRPN